MASIETHLRKAPKRSPESIASRREYSRRYAHTERAREAAAKRRETQEGRAQLARATAKWYTSTKGRALALWHAAKKRADKKGLPFEITRDWVWAKLEKGVCEVTEIPFEFDVSVAQGPKQWGRPWSPSIDQIILGGGYTELNSRVVVWAFNQAVNVYGEEVFRKLVDAYGRAKPCQQ